MAQYKAFEHKHSAVLHQAERASTVASRDAFNRFQMVNHHAPSLRAPLAARHVAR